MSAGAFATFAFLLAVTLCLAGLMLMAGERRRQIRLRRRQRSVRRVMAGDRQAARNHFRILGPDDRPAA